MANIVIKRSPENFGIKTNLKRPPESSNKSISCHRTFDRTYQDSELQFRMKEPLKTFEATKFLLRHPNSNG